MKSRIAWIAFATLSIAVTGLTQAHAHLQSSVPANHATLSVAPRSLTLEFEESVQLTALSIKKGDGAAKKIAPLPAAASKEFALPLPTIEPGAYVITWRAVGDDGHVTSATIQFSILPGGK